MSNSMAATPRPLAIHPWLASLAGVAFLVTVVLANWAVHHYGVVSVGFGQSAPAAVWFVGAALILRDLTQLALGRRAATRPNLLQLSVLVALIVVGALLSSFVAGVALALASGLAFLASELMDLSIFTWLAPRWTRAVAAAGLLAALVDSLIFLRLAFHSFQFLPGQMLGKSYGVLAAALVIGLYRGTLFAASGYHDPGGTWHARDCGGAPFCDGCGFIVAGRWFAWRGRRTAE